MRWRIQSCSTDPRSAYGDIDNSGVRKYNIFSFCTNYRKSFLDHDKTYNNNNNIFFSYNSLIGHRLCHNISYRKNLVYVSSLLILVFAAFKYEALSFEHCYFNCDLIDTDCQCHQRSRGSQWGQQ